MNYKFYCGVCKLKLSIDEKLQGTNIICPKCNIEFEAPTQDHASGDMIGDFRIDALIGNGSSAEVYSAHHDLMNRCSALKIIKHNKMNDEEHARFRREIEILSEYHHPHFINVFYAGIYKGDYYLAMDLIEGKSCSELIKIGGPMPVADSFRYALQVAEAMNYAWSKNLLIHRDIKPANILIDEQSKEAYLTDLGIAKCLKDVSELTQKDMIMGSPNYMSPEQAACKELDCRADIYALGATLYTCISGIPPYDGYKPMEILVKKLDEDVIPIGQLQSRLPQHVRRAIHKLMAFETAERPQTWPEAIKLIRETLEEIESLNIRPSHNKNYTKTTNLHLDTFSSDFAQTQFPLTLLCDRFRDNF